jgi:signal peptidase I
VIRARKLRIPRPRGRLGGLVELVVIVALALGLALAVQAWVVKPYQIPSGSMEPTLAIGQRVLVNRFDYRFSDPKPGDIVVFHPPAGADHQAENECGVAVQGRDPIEAGEACPRPTAQQSSQTFIKRIVAGPGDTLSVKEGHPVVNGVEKKNEPYIRPCGGGEACNLPKTITVPPGDYFMMGDNRGESDDSRFWGPVPRSWIIGKAFATYWPPDRIGTL